jgi:hypothetical protein
MTGDSTVVILIPGLLIKCTIGRGKQGCGRGKTKAIGVDGNRERIADDDCSPVGRWLKRDVPQVTFKQETVRYEPCVGRDKEPGKCDGPAVIGRRPRPAQTFIYVLSDGQSGSRARGRPLHVL